MDGDRADMVSGTQAPLSSDELAEDIAASPQDLEQDPLHDSGKSGDDTGLPASEADLAGSDTEASGRQDTAVESALINLPPG